jgi:5-methylcytosine-specific restriction endonuclease McrA
MGFSFTYHKELAEYLKSKKNVRVRETTRTKRITKRLLEANNYMCALCGEPTTLKDSNIDHKIPKSKGGSNRIENLQATHKACNFIKGNKI